jgi:hypothetical protein
MNDDNEIKEIGYFKEFIGYAQLVKWNDVTNNMVTINCQCKITFFIPCSILIPKKVIFMTDVSFKSIK